MPKKLTLPATEGRTSCSIPLGRDVSKSLATLANSRRVQRSVSICARISTRHSPSNFSLSTRHSLTSRIRFNSCASNYLIFSTRHLTRTPFTRHSTPENRPKIALQSATLHGFSRAFQKLREVLDTHNQHPYRISQEEPHVSARARA
jgi:hypothetical protein